MRTLALLLFLVNIGFLAWQMGVLPWLPWQPSQKPVLSQSPPPNNLPQLVLWSEQKRAENPVEIASSSPDTKESEGNSEESVTDIARNITPQQVTPTNHDKLPLPTAVQANINHVTHVHQKVMPNRLLTQTSEQTDEPTLLKLQQLEQSDDLSNALPDNTMHQIATSPPALQSSSITPEICFQVGHYTQLTQINTAKRWLKKKNVKKTKIEKLQTRTHQSTWVYLPPFKNRKMAYQAQQRLVQAGVTDHLIVTQGQFKNAISLGLYREQKSVKRRLNTLQAKGYQTVKTEKRYKNSTTYWLNVKIPKVQETLLNAFQEDFKGIQVKSVACE